MTMFFGIILFWLSIFGYLLYLKNKTKLPYELLLPILFSITGIFMFISGILNIMIESTIIIFITGIILFIKNLKQIKIKNFCNINFIIFVIVFIYITIVGSRLQLLHYDNFSHWGLIVKNMFLNNRLPNLENAVIEFITYQPGSACFIYYFGALTGKTESSMIIAQNYMLIAYLFSLFVFTNKKGKDKKNYIFKSLIVSLYIFILFGNTSFNDLLVDTLIATMSISSFTVMYYFKDNLKKAFIYNLPTLIFLFLVKNTGIVLIAFTCLGFLYLGFKNKELKKGFYYALLTGIISVVFYYIWTKHVHFTYGYSALSSKHALTPNNMLGQLQAKGLDKIIEFCKIYLRHFLDISNNISNMYMIGINLVVILMIFIFKDHKKHFITCLIMSNMLYFMYYIILGIMYLLSMPWAEAIVLASFDRYMLTIIFIIIALVLIFFINAVIKEKQISNKSIIMSCLLFITLLFITFKFNISNYNILIGDLDYNNSIAYKFDTILETNYFNANNNDDYYIYAPNNDWGYVYYMSKYKLNTSNVHIILDIKDLENIDTNTKNSNFILIEEDKNIFNYLNENKYIKEENLYTKKID